MNHEPKLSPYAKLWSRRLQPGWERLRKKATPDIERLLEVTQYASFDRTAARQGRALERLLEHAFLQMPFFRDWAAKHNAKPRDFADPAALRDLPLVPRRLVVDEPKLFTSRAMPEGSYPKATGGTSGHPVRFFVSPESDHWRTAISRRGYGWAGCIAGRRQVHLWSGDLTPPPFLFKLKRGLHRRLMGQRFVNNFNLGEQELDRATRLIDLYRPKVLVSFASSAESLARHALKRGWRPAHPMEGVITGAEPLYPARRELIQSALGCPVFESYGSREFMLTAMECNQHQGMHVSAENLMVEIIGPGGGPAPPGQTGEIVITDLHNLAFGFIRYQTGDLSAWLEGPCPCGRNLPRLAPVQGRVMDMLTHPDGHKVTGGIFPHLMKDYPAIKQFQVVQDRIDHLTIRLVLTGELRGEERQSIAEAVAGALMGMRVDFVEVDQIPTTKGGKVRVTIGLDG